MWLPLSLLIQKTIIMAGKTGTVLAVLAGAAVGAAIGILFAPDQGTNTRRKIKDGYGQKRDELKDKISELTEQLKGRLGTSKEGLEAGFDKLVASVEEKKDDIISTLERKLEELKSKGATASHTADEATTGGKTAASKGATGAAI